MAQSIQTTSANADIAHHERVFHGFVKFLLRAATAMIVVIVLIAMFNA